jgi:hypothetical protein
MEVARRERVSFINQILLGKCTINGETLIPFAAMRAVICHDPGLPRRNHIMTVLLPSQKARLPFMLPEVSTIISFHMLKLTGKHHGRPRLCPLRAG